MSDSEMVCRTLREEKSREVNNKAAKGLLTLILFGD